MHFALFIGIVQSILLVGHWFLYKTWVRFFGLANPSGLWTMRIGMALLSISLVATSLLAFRHSNLLVRCLYTGAVSWLGIFYLLILAAILGYILYGLARLFQMPLDRKILMEILIGMAFAGSLYGWINAAMIRITRIDVQLPGLSGAWKGKTAVWVSDTHLGHVRNHGFARRLVEMVQACHPDVVFIGGDLYDGLAVDVDEVIEPFSRISAPYGTYFITGNHEEFYDNTPYLEAARRAGMRVLYNEKVELDGLQIIGVDYRETRQEGAFQSILKKIGIDRQRPSLLLKHAPFHIKAASDHGITFQLSGHTHQGQVFLFRFITSRIYQGYDYGLKRFGDLIVYTSSGAGTWGPPMRLDTRSEIVVVTFK
ncbi:MAG: metallophosphoesterase [Thermodesulfobacteriota bacterium]